MKIVLLGFFDLTDIIEPYVIEYARSFFQYFDRQAELENDYNFRMVDYKDTNPDYILSNKYFRQGYVSKNHLFWENSKNRSNQGKEACSWVFSFEEVPTEVKEKSKYLEVEMSNGVVSESIYIPMYHFYLVCQTLSIVFYKGNFRCQIEFDLQDLFKNLLDLEDFYHPWVKNRIPILRTFVADFYIAPSIEINAKN